MVKQFKIEPVYKDESDDEVEVKNEVEEPIAPVEIEAVVEQEESKDIEIIEHATPNEVIKNKTKGIDMPITKKVLEQVQCTACLKYMSEKNLRYSHPKYCLESITIETPTEIPIPKLKIKNDDALKNKIILPVKNLKLKKAKSVAIVNEKPVLEIESKPIVVTPVVEKVLNAQDVFRSQMNDRIEVRKQNYNTLLEGAF